MEWTVNRTRSVVAIALAALSANACALATRTPLDRSRGLLPAGCRASSVVEVRRVQQSALFLRTARAISDRLYPYPADAANNVTWLCGELALGAFQGAEALNVVYGPAELGIQRVDVVFGVGPDSVALLSAIEDGRVITGAIDKVAWNRFIAVGGGFSVRTARQASALGCVLSKLQDGSFGGDDCSPGQVAVLGRIDGIWTVHASVANSADGATYRLAEDGSLL